MPVSVSTPIEQRSVGRAVLNGLLLRCPHCGKGHMFRAYLKVADKCDVCREELFHHRADDFPPYLTIVLVGHIIIFTMLELMLHFDIEPWLYMVTLGPLAVILPMILLPSVKGAVVGLQWANRMHGFDPASRHPDPALPSYP
jgi:uncharacterized protein (DUF983 family)